MPADVPNRIVTRLQRWAEGKDAEPCWAWPLSRMSQGYGQIGWVERGKRGMELAHRLAWLIFRGPIPPGMVVDHRCHEDAWQAGLCDGGVACPHRECWNPGHLRLLTNAANSAATASRNRDTCAAGRHPWPASAVGNGYRASGRVRRTCGPCRSAQPARAGA